MKHQSKLSKKEQQQHLAEQQIQHQSAQEFSTVEEVLRYDAAHTTVPPKIAQKLQSSLAQSPQPLPSWWKNIFKK